MALHARTSQEIIELATATARHRYAVEKQRLKALKRLQDRLSARKGLLEPKDKIKRALPATMVRPKSTLEAMAEEETILMSHRVQAEAKRASKLHSQRTLERRKTSDQRLNQRLAARNKVKSSRCLQKSPAFSSLDETSVA